MTSHASPAGGGGAAEAPVCTIEGWIPNSPRQLKKVQDFADGYTRALTKALDAGNDVDPVAVIKYVSRWLRRFKLEAYKHVLGFSRSDVFPAADWVEHSWAFMMAVLDVTWLPSLVTLNRDNVEEHEHYINGCLACFRGFLGVLGADMDIANEF